VIQDFGWNIPVDNMPRQQVDKGAIAEMEHGVNSEAGNIDAEVEVDIGVDRGWVTVGASMHESYCFS
jgi:hypothetical protein